jgi:MerR family transcriptional regulator/heat shock protein HspR
VARERPARRRTAELVGEARGVFMISVAAELAGMHPQTLRVYEARGLIKPSRSPKKTRLYSQQDVKRLRRIQELTTEFGMNLAGVERVLALEELMEGMNHRLEQMKKQAAEMEREMLEQIEAVHRSYKRELVRWEPPGEILRMNDSKPFTIPVQRLGRPATNPAAAPAADGPSEPEAKAGGGDAAG